jgi:EmrB/QacA subfamily drug resistance transporter
MESSASAGRLAPDVLDPRRWRALALLCGAFFMVLLDGTITLVALPSIGADLGFAKQDLQWVLSAYALAFGGLLLLGGRAADLLGRRRVFMAGVLLFTVASLTCGLAWSPGVLLAARVIQGAGAAIMTPTALSIISTTFTEGSERNKALGIWGALGGIGATTAWLIGGPLVDGPGWRWIFLINVPIGLAALALSPAFLGESRAALTRRSYDPAGALTITGALVLLVYAVVKAPGTGWGDIRTILPLAGSALLVAAFVLIESRHPAPLVPLRIFRSRTLAGANALTVLIGTVAVGMPFVLTLYAQQVLGYSALKFGVSTVVLALGATAGAIAGQGAILKVGFRPVAAAGLALMGAGSLVLTQVSAHGSYFPDIFLGLLLCGLGIGLAFVTATVAALAGVAGHEAGLASGLSNTSLQVGTALGVAIVSTIAVSRSKDYLAAHAGANPLAVLTEPAQVPAQAAGEDLGHHVDDERRIAGRRGDEADPFPPVARGEADRVIKERRIALRTGREVHDPGEGEHLSRPDGHLHSLTMSPRHGRGQYRTRSVQDTVTSSGGRDGTGSVRRDPGHQLRRGAAVVRAVLRRAALVPAERDRGGMGGGRAPLRLYRAAARTGGKRPGAVVRRRPRRPGRRDRPPGYRARQARDVRQRRDQGDLPRHGRQRDQPRRPGLTPGTVPACRESSLQRSFQYRSVWLQYSQGGFSAAPY